MIFDSPKSFQPTKKDIKYLNKDFSQLRQSLVDFAKVYYPNTYKDFNESSVGMMFMEQAAYVGDVLSYYIDYQFKESVLVNTEERGNIIAAARSIGYRPKVTTPSVTTLDVYQLIPAKWDSAIEPSGSFVPDLSYAQIIKPGMMTTSDTGQSFITNVPVDFTVDTQLDPLEISVYQRDTSGHPEFYVLKKNTIASAGQIVTKTISVGDPTQYLTVQLGETNVINVLDVYDSDGNKWYETDYLAQDLVPVDVENIYRNDMALSSFRDTTPFLMTFIRTSRRFITGINSDNSTFMQFGPGTNISSDEVIIPSGNTVTDPSKLANLNVSYDPSNFLTSKSYGQSPSNTTLTIRYVVGGGIDSNVNANSIKNITSVEFFGDITELLTHEQDLTNMVRKMLKVNNPIPATGGTDAESNDDIKNNALANYASQNRAVTQKDYVVRTYSMPPKYGAVAKVYAMTDTSLGSASNVNPFAINLYILCYDANKNLIKSNSAIQQNLRNYLDQYRMMTDSVNLMDGYIINIGVEFSIIAYKNYNKRDVLTNCISLVQQFFDIGNTQFYQPINLSRLELEIGRVEGVQSVPSLVIKNLTSVDGDYSPYEYNISQATVNKVVYPSLDPSIFEVRHPSKDIVGRVL